jgi:hypothetical protein
MTKPTWNIRFDAPASVAASPAVSTPVQHLPGDDNTAFVSESHQLPGMLEPNNPVLTRTNESSGRSLPGAAVTGGAVLTSLLSALGCTGQGDVAIAAIGLGWGLATVAAWGGILLGLNKLAGWLEGEPVGADNIKKFIKKGDWNVIEKALLDEGREPKELAGMQEAVLEASDRIPHYMLPWMYKAVALANDDAAHVAKALDGLLASNIEKSLVLHALTGIVQARMRKPNEEIDTFVARAVMNFEWRHPGYVRDTLLANAVALSHYWRDSLILIGTLSTRIKIGHTSSNAYLIGALKHLRDKPFADDVFQHYLPPFLVDIDGVQPYWDK